MNIFNVMNFVRACDERDPNYKENLFSVTKRELELVTKFDIENTFLLQYDALCDERYVELFKNSKNKKTELGIWLEIVEPMTTACSLPYKSEHGWKWDWHIIPGLPMGYTPEERCLLIDETMRKFKETFGFYPKTVGGWLIDTYTMKYFSDNYDIDAFCICRDQVNTDAYTLIGGYFNGGYYPSKNNIFTPAQTEENQIDIPVFRLLGPCPVNNYDGIKFLPKTKQGFGNVYSLEPVWGMGADEKCVDWFFKTYFENESLGFSAIQLGQENSFTDHDFLPKLRMQLEKALQYVSLGKAEFMTYSKTGQYFKKKYKSTPTTAVTATDNWNEADTQSVYYDSKNYTANIFRENNTIFLRALYLFDEKNKDYYYDERCTRFDAIYENLPIVDTVIWQEGNKENIGIVLDNDAEKFEVKKTSDGVLSVFWKDKSVVFKKDCIDINGCGHLSYSLGESAAEISSEKDKINFKYKGNCYSLIAEICDVKKNGNLITFNGNEITFKFRR